MKDIDIDGHTLTIQAASFEKAMKLKFHLGKAISVKDLDLSNISVDKSDPLKTDIGSDTIGSLIENAIAVATDPSVMDSLFSCCEKVVMLDKNLIDKSFFNKVENREFYYPIMIEVIKENVSPFFGKISSMFSGAGELMGKFQKQK